jgi:hypothetical protein
MCAAQNADSANADSARNVKLSGYVTSSYTYASHPAGNAITGRLYDRFHDQIGIGAARVTLEQAVATDQLDAGFRVDALFGQNAAPLRSTGLSLGDQGDLPQAFVTLNAPTGPETYVQFKAGKMWTLLDVEVVDEVLNPSFSHGYQYIYLTNFTNTGFGVDAKFSPDRCSASYHQRVGRRGGQQYSEVVHGPSRAHAVRPRLAGVLRLLRTRASR